MSSSASATRQNAGVISFQAYDGSGSLISPVQVLTKIWKTIGLDMDDIVAKVKMGNGQTTKSCTVRADHSFTLEANFYDDVNASPLPCPNGPQNVTTFSYGTGPTNLISQWQDFDLAVDIMSTETSGGSEKYTFHQAFGREYSGSVKHVIPLSSSPKSVPEMVRLASSDFTQRKVTLSLVIGAQTFNTPIHIDKGAHSVDDIQEGTFNWTNDGDPTTPALGNSSAGIIPCAFGGTALGAVSVDTGYGIYTGDCLIQRLGLRVVKEDVIALSAKMAVQNGWALAANS